MKWMIASDLHGSARFTRLLLDAWQRERADRLLLLGDLLYHGPRNDLPPEYDPKQVIALLSPLKGRVFAVRGNCEAQVDQMVLPFPILAESCLLESQGRLIYATHGHLYHSQNLPPLSGGDILLQGHTHVPAKLERQGILCLNPGSVSIPKENSPHSYMTLEGGLFQWKELDGQAYDSFKL